LADVFDEEVSLLLSNWVAEKSTWASSYTYTYSYIILNLEQSIVACSCLIVFFDT
jgi:hypothetical protein